MADATPRQLADLLYVDPDDIEVVLAGLAEDGDVPDDGLIPQWLCDEVSEVLDPWPLVRRVPDVYKL